MNVTLNPGHVADTNRIQRIRQLFLPGVVAAQIAAILFHRSIWIPESLVSQSLIRFGVLLIAAAIGGRIWVWAYLGRRRRSELVTDGPYSVVRHPLYALSVLAAAGVGTQSGSFIVTIFAALSVWLIFDRIARIEDRGLAFRFGPAFHDYAAKTRRFWPRPSLWMAPQSFPVESKYLLRALFDSSAFALAVPAFLLLDWAQREGFLPVLFRLP